MHRSAWATVVGLLVGCGPVLSNDNSTGNHNIPNGECTENSRRCRLSNWQICRNGEWQDDTACTGSTPYCLDEVGCVQCEPNLTFCDGNTVMICDANGSPAGAQEVCDPGLGESCQGGRCASPCRLAEERKSYIGCDYWPTPTSNAFLDTAYDTQNDFGVVVHNANEEPTTVTIERGGSPVGSAVTIPAGSVHTFKLSLDTGLKGSESALGSGTYISGKIPDAAYHLVSDRPVTVYQFNPLNYSLATACENGGDNPCHSYSNDASLLLPRHVLSTNYLVMSRQSFALGSSFLPGMPASYTDWLPGYVTIVATVGNTDITVKFSCFAMVDNQSFTPGDSHTFTGLEAGEALQILSSAPSGCTESGMSERDLDDDSLSGYKCCDSGPDYDLTGTEITATQSVAVYAGHDCSYVPFYYQACDHLEEQLFPLETWGKEFVVAWTKPQYNPSHSVADPANFHPEPNVIRVLSGAAGNQIVFTPASIHAPVTLGKGEYVEFMVREHFKVEGTGALMVGQFTVGQNSFTEGGYEWNGDPAFALAVPYEQFRTSYSFLTPDTMNVNFVNVVAEVHEGSDPVYITAPGDASPMAIDPADFSTPIAGTQWAVAQLDLSAAGGAYLIESDSPFGILVYGFGAYTSYMYPGGLDLKFINPVD